MWYMNQLVCVCPYWTLHFLWLHCPDQDGIRHLFRRRKNHIKVGGRRWSFARQEAMEKGHAHFHCNARDAKGCWRPGCRWCRYCRSFELPTLRRLKRMKRWLPHSSLSWDDPRFCHSAAEGIAVGVAFSRQGCTISFIFDLWRCQNISIFQHLKTLYRVKPAAKCSSIFEKMI